MNVSELFHFTLNNESTKSIIERYKNFINVDKYEKLIMGSDAAKWKIYTYEDYQDLYLPILNCIKSNLTITEYQSFINYKSFVDRLVLELFKDLV